MSLNRRNFIGAGVAAALPGSLIAQVVGADALPATALPLPAVPGLPKPSLLTDARPVASSLGLDPRIWNWRSGADRNGPMPANYYEASLSEWPAFGPLPGDQSCDVVVIGGGLLGASAALHLAEAGLDVIVLEKDHIGSGASGRNGGQLTPGLARWEAGTMAANLPPDEARRLWRFASVEAMELIDSLSARYDFQCDRKRGHITAALHPGHMGALVEGADARRQLGDRAVRVIGPHEVQEYVRSQIYHGATLDSSGGQLQPLALLRGLVYGFVQQGGRVYDGTPVQEIEEGAGGTTVITERGTIKARRGVVLAVHSSTFRFLPEGSTTLPFVTYVAVTPKLPMPISELLPGDLPVYDTQFQIDYYRAVRDNRLLFGGQGTGNSWSPRDVNNYLLERIRTVFPQWEQPALEYSWGGISDVTINGATDSRKSAGKIPVYIVHGWSGHGVAQTVRIGKAISDDLTGRNDDFAMLTQIEHGRIPLGNFLAPLVIPVAKGMFGIKAALQPSDMVSF
ncbi:gamma-glutamylputrescine oxidase [Lampropedia hyalina DSM 16112]|jgi:gamma-glutamylputrescine oxidase|uniref:Gamma-glutamylputrescine oxidase n=1 Tax=Lampropedia hyalina DSM 16112 TaxID=1122156 RepID=A0A1M4ZG90_9BURK|nr:gamma-glutamylputrescine oxidase [Lampropedia hyalina DSM 16112]